MDYPSESAENNHLKPKKSLGQHFLRSKKVLDTMIKEAQNELSTNTDIENILEIGPGEGVLTQALLEKIDKKVKIVAIEKDSRAMNNLMCKFESEINEKRLNIKNEDVLDFIENEGLKKLGCYAVVANIPYYITGLLFEKLLENNYPPKFIIFLVQEEVADRIVSKDGRQSLASIAVQVYALPKKICRVPRGAFYPPPNVESAILKISKISKNNFIKNGIKERDFFKIVKSGFAHKRKKVSSNLKEVIHNKSILLSLDNKRAEELDVAEWLSIAKNTMKQVEG